MPEEQYWLTVFFKESKPCWPPNIKKNRVLLKSATTFEDFSYKLPYRTSPIFPLHSDYIKPSLDSCFLFLYSFESAFTILGKLQNIGSDNLKKSLWYTFGLASILLITKNSKLNKELLEIAKSTPNDIETWKIENEHIVKISVKSNNKKKNDSPFLQITNYGKLPLAERSIVDEFVANISLIVPKVIKHLPNEYKTYPRLVKQMDELIKELVYLSDPQGPPPLTLEEYTEVELKSNMFLRERIKNQNIDRLIQVNSALSYISTQMLSGAVPILERRSLIRRHSLLGISTAILALNQITRSIEAAFAQFSLEDIIVDRMKDAKPLPGLEKPPNYDASNWGEEYSVNNWSGKVPPRIWFPKLPYFSGRLGFRETEYTISIALQSLTSGSSLQWNILTITHELLHGYVRNIITLLFDGDPKLQETENWNNFYTRFAAIADKKDTAQNEQESLRALILIYCSLTYTLGSLTGEINHDLQDIPQNSANVVRQITEKFYLLTQEQLIRQYEDECRNISEIFVHILDLHYFYGSRLSAYIPLIWRSWAELPHVNADLRQYILRSLLVISTKVSGDPYERFNLSRDRLEELLSMNIDSTLDVPTVHEVINYLNNETLREELFYPYLASLILVDMCNKIFVSRDIRNHLLKDPLIRWPKDEYNFEEDFEYKLVDGFSEEYVLKPTAYLLNRFIKKLHGDVSTNNTEAETALLYLACCSFNDNEEEGKL